MNLLEKNLYQQIHPARLITDVSTAFGACYFFWQHDVVGALIVAFIPSLFVSLTIVRFANLERIKNSAFGRYHKRIYNKTVEFIRLAGLAAMAIASWYQSLDAAGAGFAVILITWSYGLFTKK
ncbi:MAG: hypothetical protein WCW35_09210 [Bacteroidota bacterium]|jgi:hypothetical protein